MTGGPRPPLTRPGTGPQRADLLELFFDLAFIASLTLTSQKMAAEQTWTGIAQALLALSTLWAVWVTTTLITDTYSPRKRPISYLILAIMFGIMLMSAALPTAFHDHGLVFGGTWAAINLGRGLVLIRSLRGRQGQERSIRALVWSLIAGVLWVVGALLADPGLRLSVWLAALAVDYIGFGFRFPVPGRAALPQYQVTPEHLAERYQQIYTLTLGELVLVSVLSLSHQPFTPDRIAAFGTAFLTAVVLWWSYAGGAGATLRAAIEASPHRARLVQTNPYAHWLMVAGVVSTAAGVERIIAAPGQHPGSVMTALILGGAGLFLCGRAVLEHEVYGPVPLSHVLGVAATIILAPFAAHLSGLALGVVAALVLSGVVVAELLRNRRGSAPASVAS
ncbi:low temperature requirement protein A [Micromonospora tarensis]|uniref:Low temperature requirement protein A n=1 Tax=Micromonospora tarensis TaxID=2806100 RepID=A0ABS1YDD5_9ACTN|nr:low temperature requirement protein A [Micromonospora tarensis]MBM0275372.1 low temperature requirement protein A [Micromonospora tarensis]